MTNIKNTTKKAQEIINEYRHAMSHRKDIYQAYSRPSYNKVQAFNDIRERANNTEGYNHDLSVSGAGCHFFSTVYSFVNEVGKTIIVKDTASNIFCVELPENI